jgi:hypothetical protein
MLLTYSRKREKRITIGRQIRVKNKEKGSETAAASMSLGQVKILNIYFLDIFIE